MTTSTFLSFNDTLYYEHVPLNTPNFNTYTLSWYVKTSNKQSTPRFGIYGAIDGSKNVSLFQIYEWGSKDEQRHPRMMLRVKNGVLEPRYYPVNGRDVSGNIIKYLFIDDMKDKWTTIVFHTKMGKAPGEGFSKMYVNGVLYNEYNGRTGISSAPRFII